MADVPSDVLPSIFVGADEASQAGQRRHVRASAARLVLSIAAAVCAALASDVSVGSVAILGLCAAAAFFAALAVEIWMLVARPERAWYDGRAIAESAKTLAWRYAVGAKPFDIGDAASGERLLWSLDDLEQAADAAFGASDARTDITPGMAALRERPLDVRRTTYLRDRVIDQQEWWARKANANSTRAARLRVAMLVGEFLGVCFALSEAFGYLDIALSGIAATSIGAGAAWLAVRQHESTSHTYALASDQLRGIAEDLATIEDEEEWAMAVTSAEDVITREHAAWHASRTARTLPGGLAR